MPAESIPTRALVSRCCLLVVGLIGTTVVLSGVGHCVVHSHAITTFDRHVTNWVIGHRSPMLNTMMKALTWIGSWVAAAVTGGVVLVLTLTKRLANAALLVLAIAWAGEVSMVNIVKYTVDRPRPPRVLWLVNVHGASFPSGHAANATLVCTAATVVVFLVCRRRWIRTTTVVVSGVAIVTVGFSRVELGVHWTTDVLAGSLATLMWLAAVAGLIARSVPLVVPRSAGDRSGSERATD